jgi:hypothetical protein
VTGGWRPRHNPVVAAAPCSPSSLFMASVCGYSGAMVAREREGSSVAACHTYATPVFDHDAALPTPIQGPVVLSLSYCIHQSRRRWPHGLRRTSSAVCCAPRWQLPSLPPLAARDCDSQFPSADVRLEYTQHRVSVDGRRHYESRGGGLCRAHHERVSHRHACSLCLQLHTCLDGHATALAQHLNSPPRSSLLRPPAVLTRR